MIKGLGSVAAVVAAAGLALSVSGTSEAATKRQFITIGTGGPTGVYFVVGNTICRLVHKEAAEGRKKGRKHGIRCSAPSSGGSTYNIGQIAAGEFDFGVAQSDWQYHAYNGTSDKVTKFNKLRAVFSVHPSPTTSSSARIRASTRGPASRARGSTSAIPVPASAARPRC